MLEYIYFVKCPNCEDEPFSFFNEAKEFAMSCLSKKPIITQVEVDRNDFGECQDSCDLGTVWSWEELMGDVSSEAEPTAFSKADTLECDDCFDQEFDSLDNSLDSVPDNFRKPVTENIKITNNQPAQKKSIEDLTAELQDFIASSELTEAKSLDKSITIVGLNWLLKNLMKLTSDKQREDFFVNHFEQDFREWLPSEIRDELAAPPLYLNLTKLAWIKYLDLYRMNIKAWIKRWETSFRDNGNLQINLKDYPEVFVNPDRIVATMQTEQSQRKPVPADMSIEDLVEAMEENEDEVECTWCNELFGKDQCRKEVDLGWLCDRCQAAIKSRGEPLTFRENDYWDFLDESTDSTIWYCFFDNNEVGTVEAATEEEALEKMQDKYPELQYSLYDGCFYVEPADALKESFKPDEEVEFIYDTLLVTLQGPKRDVDDWDESDESVRHSFYKTKEDVATDIWENFIEEADVKDVEGGLETLEDDVAWTDFLIDHFDDLLDKYYDKLLKYYEDDARKDYEETHSLNESSDAHDLVELEYPSLTVTLYGEKRTEDDWDEEEYTDSHVFLVPKVEVATAIWENWITEEDVKDVEGGLETLDDDAAWEKFLETHFDDLFEKYNKQILEYFKDEATEDFRERSQEETQLNKWSTKQKQAYADLDNDFNESAQKPFLEEFDDAETHKASLIDCPECGSVSYDMKEQYCTNCGLNL